MPYENRYPTTQLTYLIAALPVEPWILHLSNIPIRYILHTPVKPCSSVIRIAF